MKQNYIYAQLFLRLTIGIGFIVPVLDRLGLLGPAGTPNIAWGNYDAFLSYTHILLPVLPKGLSDVFGHLATVAEALFGTLLILGFKTRLAAYGSCLLTVGFIITMSFALGIKAPLNYSVFTVSAASFLLACLPEYKWSLDRTING